MRSLIKTTLSAIALVGVMTLPMAAHAAPNQAEAVATTYTSQPFVKKKKKIKGAWSVCLLYTSPSPRDKRQSRMPSSA